MADLGVKANYRYVRVVLPAQAAGTATGATPLKTFDDNALRNLNGAYVSGGGALQHTQLDLAGRVFADIDHAMFGTGRGPLELDVDYPAGVIFDYNAIVDVGGTAIAANATVLTLRYTGPKILAQQ